MSVWAEIQYAINSTLLTPNFKPLDQIITGEKVFVGSDSTLVALPDIPEAAGSVLLGTFTPKINGTIRIFGTYNCNIGGGTTRIKLSINGITYTVAITASGSRLPYSVDVNVVANTEYEIRGSHESSLSAVTASIGAIAVDSNYYDYES